MADDSLIIDGINSYSTHNEERISLVTLPPELMAIILGKLDTRSAYNLYRAGVRDIQGLITKCEFSAKLLSTFEYFRKSDFFEDISGHLKVLNLSGVPKLDLPTLEDALKNMTALIDLDVTNTLIGIPDFLQIVQARPTLKSIAIDFKFGFRLVEKNECCIRYGSNNTYHQVNEDLSAYQQAFEGFKSVHFVGGIHAKSYGALAVRMLERAELYTLKFLTWGSENSPTNSADARNMRMVKTSLLQLNLIPHGSYYVFDPPIFSVIDFLKYEILIIKEKRTLSNVRTYNVLATRLVKKIICGTFPVQVTCLSEWPEISVSAFRDKLALETSLETVFMLWDRERTAFDDRFNANLLSVFEELCSADHGRDVEPGSGIDAFK